MRNNFGVNVKAVRIDWMLDKHENANELGLLFFRKLSHSKNLELFKSETITMLIEFYYQMLKYPILVLLMVLNCLQLTVFILSLMTTEKYSRHHEDKSRSDALFFSYFNLVLTLIQFGLGASEIYTSVFKYVLN